MTSSEEVHRKHIEEDVLVEDSKLLASMSLIAKESTREMIETSKLLAKTTEKLAKHMEALTIALIAAGFFQIVIAIIMLVTGRG